MNSAPSSSNLGLEPSCCSSTKLCCLNSVPAGCTGSRQVGRPRQSDFAANHAEHSRVFDQPIYSKWSLNGLPKRERDGLQQRGSPTVQQLGERLIASRHTGGDHEQPKSDLVRILETLNQHRLIRPGPEKGHAGQQAERPGRLGLPCHGGEITVCQQAVERRLQLHEIELGVAGNVSMSHGRILSAREWGSDTKLCVTSRFTTTAIPGLMALGPLRNFFAIQSCPLIRRFCYDTHLHTRLYSAGALSPGYRLWSQE